LCATFSNVGLGVRFRSPERLRKVILSSFFDDVLNVFMEALAATGLYASLLLRLPMNPQTNHSRRRWTVVVIGVCAWVTANIILYRLFDDSSSRRAKAPREPDAAVLAAYDECTLNDNDRALRYRLLRPVEQGRGRHYPLLVYLHGAGQRGSDNRRQLLDLPSRMIEPEYRERCNCFVLAPQCPEHGDWSSYTLLDGDDSRWAVAAMIDAVCAEHPVDAQRIYLTGFSMGGRGTWGLAAQRPDLVAAIVPVCGNGDPAIAAQLKHLPVWAVHGSLDQVIPPQQSQQMIDALTAAGGQPLYTEVPDEGHSTQWAYSLENGVLAWLFAQRRKQ